MSTRAILRAAAAVLLCGAAFAIWAQSSSSSGSMSGVSATDRTFMTNAAADGLAEVHMGQMALQKSSNAQVKKLAQRIVDDHTQANEKLRTLAQSKQVTLPTTPSQEEQQHAAKTEALSGTNFDQAWAKGMVRDHRKAVAMFNGEITKTKDPQVKQFAATTLPVLKTHLKLAQQLQSQLK